MIAGIVWYSILAFAIIWIANHLFKDITKSQNSENLDSPFRIDIEKKISKEDLLELQYKEVMPIIALTTSLMLWGILFFLHKDFNLVLENYIEYKGFTIIGMIFSFLSLGAIFMKRILKKVEGNELYDTDNEAIMYQRAKTLVNFYLSIILGALVFTFLSDISFNLKLVKYGPSSFVVGSSLYLLLRQTPKNKKVLSIIIAALRGSDNEFGNNFSSKEEIDKEDKDINL